MIHHRLIYLLLVSFLTISCVNKKETSNQENLSTPASQLIGRLGKVVSDGNYIYGHSDDTAYGHTWQYESGRSDVKEVTGDYPGIINWDLGMIEMDSLKNLDGVPFKLMREEIIRQHERGGINTISWHPRNPATGGDTWDTSDSTIMKQIMTPDSEINNKMVQWIGKTADFIGSLKDSKGQIIPVVFRPWHEMSGDWFWWGAKMGTSQDYKALWEITKKIFDEKGIDNVVWAYSPDRVNSEQEYMANYPGDDYVDIVGIDVYQFGGSEGEESYRQDLAKGLDIASKVATDHKKILALTETGLESIPVADWHTRVMAPVIEKYPIAYVSVWRNTWEGINPIHYYAPFPGHPAADDFVEFYKNPKTLFAGDLKNY